MRFGEEPACCRRIAGRLCGEADRKAAGRVLTRQREATRDGLGERPCFVVQCDFFCSSCRASLARWASSSSSLAKPAR